MSHTPGPWKACNSATVTLEDIPTITPSHVKRVFKNSRGERVHQFIADCNMSVEEHASNAHLIAAAPDLLEALVKVRDWLESFSVPPTSTIDEKEQHYEMVHRAIAKAEGR